MMIARRGYTLIELLVVLTIGSSVLAVAAEVVHRSMEVANSMNVAAANSPTIDRWGRRFREDVHRGARIESTSPQQLIIHRDGFPSIFYRASTHRLNRSERRGEQEDRDECRLSDSSYAEFHFDDRTQLATLSVYLQTSKENDRPRMDRRIEAILTRDQHLHLLSIPDEDR